MKLPPIIGALLLAAFLLSLTTLATGKSKKSTPAPDTSDRISAIHLTSITISIYATQSSKEFKVTPATKIAVNGHSSQLSDLATGMDVVVTPAADGFTAAKIEAKTRHQ